VITRVTILDLDLAYIAGNKDLLETIMERLSGVIVEAALAEKDRVLPYHKHAYISSLADRPDKGTPFQYCEMCKCYPDVLMALNPNVSLSPPEDAPTASAGSTVPDGA
jgi:hypothetical protein